jgi:hypothetical protein
MAQDYIMRLVEQVTRMLAAILAHRKAGRDAEAALEIEANCRRTIGLPLALVRRSSPEALAELLQQAGGLRHARAVMLAELLLQDADLRTAANRPADALCSRVHAFCLLTDSIGVLSREESALYHPRLEVLARELEAFSDEPYIQQKLHAYRAKAAA